MTRHGVAVRAITAFIASSLATSCMKFPQQSFPSAGAVTPVEVVRTNDYSEGVVVDYDGNIYFSHGKIITVVAPDGTHRQWAETGEPNGHKILPDGTHLVCDASHHAVLHLDASGDVVGKAASECEGKPLRGPNDLTLDRHGGFYFTDPGGSSADAPIGTIHYVDSEGTTHLVDEGLAFPNGIVITAPGTVLFVAESQRNHILAYDVVSPGKVTNRRVFVTLPEHPSGDPMRNQPDGICLDLFRNLYVAHWGMQSVHVIDRHGRIKRSYPGGNVTTSNVAFGGPNFDQLYVTGGKPGALYRLDLTGVPGLNILRSRKNDDAATDGSE